MNQIPEYRFELWSDKTIIDGFNSGWAQTGGTPGWIFLAGTWTYNVNATTPPTLQKNIPVPVNSRISLQLVLRSKLDTVVEVALLSAGQSFDTVGQEIITRYIIGSGAKEARIINVLMNTYANANQGVAIRFRPLAAAALIDISLEYIQLSETFGDKRVIQPGNWQTVSLDLERSPEWSGVVASVGGSLDLVGEDFTYIRDQLYARPSKIFKLKLKVTSGATIIEFPPVVLDTTQSLFTGEEISYRGNFQLVKEAEWTQLLSFLEERINISLPVGVFNNECIDGVINENLAAAPAQDIQFRQQYTGYAEPSPTPISVPAETIMLIGFGSRISINDNFTASKGVNNQNTLQSQWGSFFQVIGTVKLNFTVSNPGLIVEAMVDNTTNWAPLVSNISLPINIAAMPYASSVFQIRVRNSTNAARTITITGAIGDNELAIVTRMKYKVFGVGYRPWLAIKHYLARIMGEYDNLEAPVFESPWTSAGSASTKNTGSFYNPPPLSASFYKQDPTFSLPVGNKYFGGSKWILNVGTSYDVINSAYPNTNHLLVRSTSNAGTNVFTNYFSKGTYVMAGTFSKAGVVSAYKVYGHYGMRIDLLRTVNNPTSPFAGNFSTTKVYDGFSVVFEGTVGFTVQVQQLVFTIQAASAEVGKYAKTFLVSGVNSKNQGNFGVIRDAKTFALTNSPKEVLTSLRQIFGLAIHPDIDNVNGNIKLLIDELPVVFDNALSAIEFQAENFQVNMNAGYVYDNVRIGGQINEDFEYYSDASTLLSTYTSDYVTTRRLKDDSFPAYLHTPSYIDGKLSENDLFIFDLFSLSNVGGVAPVIRTTEQLTILNSNSPIQPNWVHSESRITRRNIQTLFAGGSRSYRILFGLRGNVATVDFAGDTFGAIADIDPIIARSSLQPWELLYSTAIDIADLATIIADKHKTFNVITGFNKRPTFLQKLSYNFALSVASMTMSLKAAADNLFVNPEFDNSLEPWLQTVALGWSWQLGAGDSFAKSLGIPNSVLYQEGVKANIDQGVYLQFKIVAQSANQIVPETVQAPEWDAVKQLANPFFQNVLTPWANEGAGTAWSFSNPGAEVDTQGTSQILANAVGVNQPVKVQLTGQLTVSLEQPDLINATSPPSVIPNQDWTIISSTLCFSSFSNAFNGPTQPLNLDKVVNAPNSSAYIEIDFESQITGDISYFQCDVICAGFDTAVIIGSSVSRRKVQLNANTFNVNMPVGIVIGYTGQSGGASFSYVHRIFGVEFFGFQTEPLKIRVMQFVAGVWGIAQELSYSASQNLDAQIPVNIASTKLGLQIVGDLANSINKFKVLEFYNNIAFAFNPTKAGATLRRLNEPLAWQSDRLTPTTVPDPVNITIGDKITVSYNHNGGAGFDLTMPGFPDTPLLNGSHTVEIVATANYAGTFFFRIKTSAASTGLNTQILSARFNAKPVSIYIVGRTGIVNTDLLQITRDASSQGIEFINENLGNGVTYDNLGLRVDAGGSAGYAEIYYFQKHSV